MTVSAEVSEQRYPESSCNQKQVPVREDCLLHLKLGSRDRSRQGRFMKQHGRVRAGAHRKGGLDRAVKSWEGTKRWSILHYSGRW